MSILKYSQNDTEKFAERLWRIEQDIKNLKTESKVIYSSALHYISDVPAGAGSTGTKYQCTWDANYFYICTATDTWKRIAWTAW